MTGPSVLFRVKSERRPKRLQAAAKYSTFSEHVRSNPQSRQAVRGSKISRYFKLVKCVDTKSGEEYEIIIASASGSASASASCASVDNAGV